MCVCVCVCIFGTNIINNKIARYVHKTKNNIKTIKNKKQLKQNTSWYFLIPPDK